MYMFPCSLPAAKRTFCDLRFKRFDQSQDGVLDRYEVKQVLKQMGYMTLSCKEMGDGGFSPWDQQ